MTTNITKLQRAVLEAAAIRNNHEVWPIRGKLGLNAGSATSTINQLMKKGLAEERPAREKHPVWREDGGGMRLAAVISQRGLAAIGMLPAGKAGRRSRTAVKKAPVAAKQPVVAAVSPNEPRRPRAGTKLAVLVGLLEREGGATIAELAEATGWKEHGVRGVLSGTLQTKFGLGVTSEKEAWRARVYRLTGS